MIPGVTEYPLYNTHGVPIRSNVEWRRIAEVAIKDLRFAWSSVHTCVSHKGDFDHCKEGFCPERRARLDMILSYVEPKPVATVSGEFVVYTDGASRGNPGPAAYGYALYKDGGLESTGGAYIGIQTNNIAEYRGLIAGIRALHAIGVHAYEVRMDSELIVKQMLGTYKVGPILAPWYEGVQKLIESDAVVFTHVKREFNKEADAAANEALDARREAPSFMALLERNKR